MRKKTVQTSSTKSSTKGNAKSNTKSNARNSVKSSVKSSAKNSPQKAVKTVAPTVENVSVKQAVIIQEPSVEQKKGVNKEEKQLIARYAAALITKDDFVYLDAGTTTGCMIDFITEKSATYVTNAVSHAQKLAAAGFRVYLIGGELKPTTEAVVGNQAILSLETLHFSKAFFGTNGVSLKAGFSTPDYEEAMVKKTAIGQAKKAYILADYSKFGNISSVTFEEFAKAQIITDRKPPEAFLRSKNIIVA